jgi:regulator of protease activity HflC (stomatin/prohibitin superfamily)
MKKLLSLVLLIATCSVFLESCTRIDAGSVGLQIDKYGNDKGVASVIPVRGTVFYNPYYTTIEEMPATILHKVWTRDVTEGSPTNEEFSITTKDASLFTLDIGLNLQIDVEKAASIYTSFRKPLETIIDQYVRNAVRQALTDAANGYSSDSLMSSRARFEKQAGDALIKALLPIGFHVSQFVITGLRPPESLVASINAKNNAKQDALAQELKAQSIKALAAQKRITADAEAYVNEKQQQSITPLLIEKLRLEKWNGSYGSGNVFGANTAIMKGL